MGGIKRLQWGDYVLVPLAAGRGGTTPVAEWRKVRLPRGGPRRFGRSWGPLRGPTGRRGRGGRSNLQGSGAPLDCVSLEIDRLLLLEIGETGVQDGRAVEKTLLPYRVDQETEALGTVNPHYSSPTQGTLCHLSARGGRSRTLGPGHFDGIAHLGGTLLVDDGAFPSGRAPWLAGVDGSQRSRLSR